METAVLPQYHMPWLPCGNVRIPNICRDTYNRQLSDVEKMQGH